MYEYTIIVCTSWLAYRGAPAVASVVIFTLLLALPRIVKDMNARTLTLETVAAALIGAAFVSIAHLFGAGVQSLIATI